MKIDFANLTKAYLDHKEDFDIEIGKVMYDANYIMGKQIQDLEEGLETFTGAKHAISCSSGTDALLLVLMTMDIQPGDEVITTPFTFIATAETIALLKAIPVFVDIDETTFNIDASKIEEKITSRTKAIMPVSMYGQVSDMDAINDIASKHNLAVIEDAAQSFGATYKNKKSCNLSKFACTSFFPAKPLGCFGDGGAVFTNNDEAAEKIKSLRLHGQTERYYHKHIGMGGRLDTIQAVVLNVKLRTYQTDIGKRQKVAELYNSYLKDIVKTPQVLEENTSVWAQYSVRVKKRDEIQQKLSDKGIPTAVHYPRPLHLQECFNYLNYSEGDFPIAESVSQEIISLPMNPFLTEEEIKYVAKNLIEIVK